MNYQILQRAFTIGRNFWIEDDDDHRVFHVSSFWFIFTQRLSLRDAGGNEVASIKYRFWTFKPRCEIYRDGKLIATIGSWLFPDVQTSFVIERVGSDRYETQGFATDYAITHNNDLVARVLGRWAPSIHNYSVQIMPGEDDVFILAIVLAIETMTRPMRRY